MSSPRRPPSLGGSGSVPLASPRNSLLVSAPPYKCWHRQEEAPRHSPRRCHLVFVPTPRCPSHSQIYTRLEPGQLRALGIKTQRQADYASPGTRCSLRAGTQDGSWQTHAECPQGNPQSTSEAFL